MLPFPLIYEPAGRWIPLPGERRKLVPTIPPIGTVEILDAGNLFPDGWPDPPDDGTWEGEGGARAQRLATYAYLDGRIWVDRITFQELKCIPLAK